MRIGRSLPAALVAAALLAGVAGCGGPAAPAAAPKAVAIAAPAAPAVTPPPSVAPAILPASPPPPIPILMYHVIAAPPRDAPFPGLYVTPATFAAQMAALRAAGYHALTLQQAYDIWQRSAAAPAHPVVLSFDNAYTSQFTQAVPLLKSYGWPAVLNLVVDRLNIPGGLSTAQVRTMIADGWEVDTQGLTHADLALLSPPAFAAQTVGAAQQIRRIFGVPVRFFCYPSGDYNATVAATLRNDGFLAAVTVWPGFADPSVQGALTLDRVRVSYGETAAGLLAALRYFGAQKPSPPPVAYPLPIAPAKAKPATAGRATGIAAPAGTHGATSSASATATASATAGRAPAARSGATATANVTAPAAPRPATGTASATGK